ncbi:hypothetical protein GLOTRDRAFT_112769 [Gloeophyllum trabeum ATCC 11539]|uniref:Activator of Hsp90 ATPase AHSA1-like N-terminal domain-containing protein n=1 Tax=Gloeophyllum trabeum (strain ATCC 11539 / FP-39264 / Madison 617) TaxID=670483 RepID=S7R6M9_GLOTA|nr:uncharacterized protein GLOTRDRAFT_112769 [Gloeophyllum trabeum ATCC 11539]EPQ50030.1 hypothetical protein GLOTRDRAFT_112769 [Gloeophyllum trabeum ATCC 11539]
MSSMPLSTANWHWKNKNVTPWAKTWFEQELVSVSVKGDGDEVVSISSLRDMDGDVELGQRKSKLITIFDVKMDLGWSGTASDGTEVSGKLTIPEVSHENIVDKVSDLVYEWSLSTDSSPAVDALFALAKKRLPELLEAKFSEFPKAIIDRHGKDVYVSGDNSRAGTPGPSTPSSSGKATSATPSSAAASASAPVKKPESALSTTTVSVEASFMASADDLFSMLTDEKKIPAWSRNPAVSKAQPDTEYSLFGGGVKGKYISLTPGKEIKQTWALSSPTWPSGHYATLTAMLDQGSDSTVLKLKLEGVPTGMEEEITRNLEGYYIHGFKSIGLGASL